MKKFFYGSIIFLVSLLLMIVIAANSSFVIKKAADAFAPEYDISYRNITGNIFTGVKIDGLMFKNMEISRQIKFSWNPSKILYKRIAISEVRGEHIDVDAIKALIASFSKGEDKESSEPFPFVVTVGKVYLDVNPFVEQNISIEKTVLEAKDLLYASDKIEIGDLKLQLDSNVTNIVLHASMKEGSVHVKELSVANIDSETLQVMFLPQETNSSNKEVQASGEETLNPLIPHEIIVEKLTASLKPRKYEGVAIDTLNLDVKDLQADILKIIKNEEQAFEVKNVAIRFISDVGQVELGAGMKRGVVDIRKLDVSKVDTMALQAMFISNSNESNATVSNTVSEEQKSQNTVETEKNHLIPNMVHLEHFHADILPATFDPVHILSLALDMKKIDFDVEKLLLKHGEVDLAGQSNLSNIKEHAIITNNHLDGHIILTPNKPLFDMYAPTIRKEAIGNIAIDLSASKEKVVVDLNAKAKHLFLVKSDSNVTDVNQSEGSGIQPFNVDINHLKTKVVYLIKSGKINAGTDISVTTPYSKEVTLTNHFEMEGGKLHYTGDLNAGEVKLPDGKVISPLDRLHIAYSGNEKSLRSNISSRALKGYFNIADFKKKGRFHLETKEAIEAAEIVTLPADLNATKLNAVIDVPLNFAKIVPIKAQAKITSNVADVSADLVYGETVALNVLAVIPDNSLLRHLDKNIQWAALFPLKMKARMGEKDIAVSLKAPKISSNMKMLPFVGTVEGQIHASGVTATLKSDKSGTIRLQSDVSSFKTLLATVNQFYHIEQLPKVEGKLGLSVVIPRKGGMTLNISSPQVIYHADRKTVHNIDDVKVSVGTMGDKLLIKSYQLTYNKMKFFATKPSEISVDKQGLMTISQLWLNDQLKITGGLNIKKMEGELFAKADTFHFAHEMIELDSKIDLNAKFHGVATDVTGKVTLLGGDVHYDLDTKTFPSDSDILIVQEMKKDEVSPFMDNLTVQILVNTEKPLVYKEGPVNVKANVELGIHKSVHADPMVIGSVDIVDGGSYTFQGKHFVLERSHIYFTGNPAKPMLDLTVKYQALRHLITINITGTPQVPSVLFSSVPSLTKEQILSIILFDSEEGAATNNANDMMKMMGGAMAKSALNDLGVQIDHLVIGAGNSVEVGKKLTDDITVIYINGEIPKMEMKYKYSPSIEVVVGASEQSESIDVVYTKDFNMRDDDIVIKKREKQGVGSGRME